MSVYPSIALGGIFLAIKSTFLTEENEASPTQRLVGHVASFVLGIVAFQLFSKCRERMQGRSIQTQVWRTSGNFPEQSLERVQKKEDIGIAFSGGGTRSASASLGQLAALSEIGILDRARYISAVSGGGWATTPYTFLPRHISDQVFFGRFATHPEALTMQRVDALAQSSFAEALSQTVIIDDFLKHAISGSGDETYSRAVGSLFLKPFDLNDTSCSFTYDRETRELADKNLSYYTTKDNRPFLIIGVVLLTKEFGKIPLEMTAQYTGVRGHFVKKTCAIGGSYLSSYGYDSEASLDAFPQEASSTTTQVKPSSKNNLFNLAEMMGCTSAAPQEILKKMGLDFLGFPELHYWGLNNNQTSFTPSREISHGDGAFLENLGLMPLFARQVRRVLTFVNTMEPLEYNETHEEKSCVAASIRPLFEPVPDREGEGFFSKNIVLKGGREKYLELIRALYKKKVQGETLIYTDTYSVMANPFYGVNQPYDVRITWIYNERVKEWESQLPKAVRDQIGQGELTRFPHYRTFLENAPKLIDLSERQVSLLSHLSYWNVQSNGDEILKSMSS